MTTRGGEPGPSKAIRSLEVLSVGSQRFQGLTDWLLPRAKGQHIGQPNAPVCANTPVRQQANIHPSPHERARDAQDTSRVLGRDLRIIGKHGDAIG